MFDNIFDRLKRHVFIEFYFRHERFFLQEQLERDKKGLFETYGLFNGCEETTEEIVKSLRKNKESDSVLIPLNNGFIDNVYVELLKASNVTAEYVPLFSMLYYDNDKKPHFSQITINVVKDSIWTDRIYPILMHELTHAYEDLKLRIKGKSLKGEVSKVGYQKNKIGTYVGNNVKMVISYLLYFFNSYERGAYVGQIKGELSACNKRFTYISDVMNFLKSTNIYKNYELMFELVNDMVFETNVEKQNEYLEYANKLSSYNFKTFSELKKWLKANQYKVQVKFQRILPKIAYEHLKMNEILSPTVEGLLMKDENGNIFERKE